MPLSRTILDSLASIKVKFSFSLSFFVPFLILIAVQLLFLFSLMISSSTLSEAVLNDFASSGSDVYTLVLSTTNLSELTVRELTVRLPVIFFFSSPVMLTFFEISTFASSSFIPAVVMTPAALISLVVSILSQAVNFPDVSTSPAT